MADEQIKAPEEANSVAMHGEFRDTKGTVIYPYNTYSDVIGLSDELTDLRGKATTATEKSVLALDTANYAKESVLSLNFDNFVTTDTDQSISGVKSFSASPTVPTPASTDVDHPDCSTLAVNTQFVYTHYATRHDLAVLDGTVVANNLMCVHVTGDEVVDGLKKFQVIPTAPTADASDVSDRLATTSYVHTALLVPNVHAARHNKGGADPVTSLDASVITSGTIDPSRLPASAFERLVRVTDEAARFALTNRDVQLGDTVKQMDTEVLYMVVDEDNLSNESGYEVYAAGSAQSANTASHLDHVLTISEGGTGATTSESALTALGAASLDLTLELLSAKAAISYVDGKYSQMKTYVDGKAAGYLSSDTLSATLDSYALQTWVDQKLTNYMKVSDGSALIASQMATTKTEILETVEESMGEYVKVAYVEGALQPYAQKSWVEGILAEQIEQSLQPYETSDNITTILADYYTKTESDAKLAALLGNYTPLETFNTTLAGYLTTASASNVYATKSYVTTAVTEAVTGGQVSLDGYATETWVEDKGYALKSYVDTQIANVVAGQASLDGYATETWVEGKAYATESWVTGKGYATTSWVASQGYATEEWVTAKGYVEDAEEDFVTTFETAMNG